MTYLVVPHETAADAANLWVAAITEPTGSLELEIGGNRREPISGSWQEFSVRGRPLVRAQRVRVAGLEANRRYPVRLLAGNADLARATLVTLPAELPALGELPFTCLLGSCFALVSDRGGAAGAAYVGMPAAAQPHVKFLCGDQVYLDTPAGKYLWTAFGEQDLRRELVASYVSTWTQAGLAAGFSRLLREGATYFLSDDHELWNNAPNRTPLVRATYPRPFGDGGQAWLRTATELYDLFQTPSRSDGFAVGRLSFRVLDTRLGRTADRGQFADPAELSALNGWIDGLRGPGVLVLGQPIFGDVAGPRGHLFDWALPDFRQYAELVRILRRAQHDVLVLTGDVHYGRVSHCRLPSGASLYEIIASPFALVSGFFGGKWQPPPGRFPAMPIPGAPPEPIEVEDYQLAANHFATLNFWADGPRVKLSVTAWEIPVIAGHRPVPRTAYQHTLD